MTEQSDSKQPQAADENKLIAERRAKLDKLRDDKAAAEDRWLALAEEVEALG